MGSGEGVRLNSLSMHAYKYTCIHIILYEYTVAMAGSNLRFRRDYITVGLDILTDY